MIIAYRLTKMMEVIEKYQTKYDTVISSAE